MPPRWTEPVSLGLNGSDTSYWRNSPVPQHETYRNLSSTDRSMSVTSGGTAPKGCRAGGRCSAAAGSAGVSMGLTAFHRPPSSRDPGQTDADRAAGGTTHPTEPWG